MNCRTQCQWLPTGSQTSCTPCHSPTSQGAKGLCIPSLGSQTPRRAFTECKLLLHHHKADKIIHLHSPSKLSNSLKYKQGKHSRRTGSVTLPYPHHFPIIPLCISTATPVAIAVGTSQWLLWKCLSTKPFLAPCGRQPMGRSHTLIPISFLPGSCPAQHPWFSVELDVCPACMLYHLCFVP